MKKIKAIIFDLNGIFIKSQPLSQRVEEKFGIDKDIFWNKFKDVIQVARTVHQRSSDLWQPIASLLSLNIDDFLKFWFSGEIIDYDMLDFAKSLKNQGFEIFILSNNLKERTEYYRQNFSELFEPFEDVYFSWETDFVKPDPKAFENVLKTNNLKPSECIYFDDSLKNVDTANNLGIHSCLFKSLKDTKEFIQITISSH